MTNIISPENKNVLHRNLPPETLLQIALDQGEGVMTNNGALSVKTGHRTGRSPQDRFIALDEVTENEFAWGAINQPISTDYFEKLWQRAEDYLKTTGRFKENKPS